MTLFRSIVSAMILVAGLCGSAYAENNSVSAPTIEFAPAEKPWLETSPPIAFDDAESLKPQLTQSDSQLGLTEAERAWIKANPTVDIVLTPLPPYMFMEEGKARGYVIDIVREICKRAGLEMVFTIMEPSQAMERIRSGKSDLIPAVIHSDDRAEFMYFSDRTIDMQMGIFTRAGRTDIAAASDLQGQIVASYDGYGFEDVLKKLLPNLQFVHAKDAAGMLTLVATGKADAAVQEIYSGEYLLRQNFINGVHLRGLFSLPSLPRITGSEYGVSRKRPMLNSVLAKLYASMSENDRQIIWDRWFGVAGVELSPLSDFAFSVEQSAWVDQNHVIRVGFWQQPPYLYSKNGKVVGIAVDLLDIVAERTGLNFQYAKRLERFSNVLTGLKGHDGPDLVGALMPTPERKKTILFTEPYIDSPRFIFTRDDAPFVSSIENLSGQNVAVVKDFVVHTHLVENHPDIDLLIFDTNEEALRAVSSGTALAFIGDLISTPAMINEFGLKNLKAASPSGLPDHPFAMAVRNDWPELRDILSQALAIIPASEKAAIFNKWSTVRFEHGIRWADVRKWLLIIGGFFALLILLFMVWNRQLTLRMRERTIAVLRSENRFSRVLEQSPVSIQIHDLEGKLITSNAAYSRIYALNDTVLAELRKKYNVRTDPQAEELGINSFIERVYAGEDVIFPPYRYRGVDTLKALDVQQPVARTCWVQTRGFPLRDEKGEISSAVFMSEDITEQKEAQQALQRQSAYTDHLIQTANVMIVSLDVEGHVTNFNPAAETVTGYCFSEIIGRNWFEILIPVDRFPEINRDFEHLMPNQVPKYYENPILTKSGEERIISWSNSEVVRDGEIVGFTSFGIDITDRERARLELKQSEERYRALFEESQNGILFADTETRKFRYANPAVARMLGYTQRELCTLEVQDIHPVWAHDEVIHEFKAQLANKKGVASALPCLRKDGVVIYADVAGSRVDTSEGSFSIGFFTDVTERTEAERKLRDSEEEFRSLIEQSPVSIQIINVDGGITKVNRSFCKLWGIGKSDLDKVLQKYNILEDKEVEKSGLMPLIRKALAGESVVLPIIEYDASEVMKALKLENVASNKRWIQSRFYPVKNHVGEIINIVNMVEDMTERMDSEAQVKEYQERLRALASELTLTEEQERRRIATELHDGAAQSLALARLKLASAGKAVNQSSAAGTLDELSQLLKESLQQIRGILLDLSSPSLNEIGLAAALSEWLEEQARRRQGLQTFFSNDCPEMDLNEDTLAMLFRNARELIMNTIKHAEASNVNVHIFCKNEVLHIEIEDDGKGFLTDDRQKQPGTKGGFGLFSVYERMADMGGSLEINSSPGEGCRSVLYMPMQSRNKGE